MNVAAGFNSLTRPPGNLDIQRLLIVDDEPRIRSAYRELLAGTGRIIEECSTGQEAIQRLAGCDIDVVVLDLKLPDIGGIEIMDWIVRNFISTAIIVFSADHSIDSAIHALRQGAFEFIRKQSDPDELIHSVDRALRHRHMAQEYAQIAYPRDAATGGIPAAIRPAAAYLDSHCSTLCQCRRDRRNTVRFKRTQPPRSSAVGSVARLAGQPALTGNTSIGKAGDQALPFSRNPPDWSVRLSGQQADEFIE